MNIDALRELMHEADELRHTLEDTFAKADAEQKANPDSDLLKMKRKLAYLDTVDAAQVQSYLKVVYYMVTRLTKGDDKNASNNDNSAISGRNTENSGYTATITLPIRITAQHF